MPAESDFDPVRPIVIIWVGFGFSIGTTEAVVCRPCRVDRGIIRRSTDAAHRAESAAAGLAVPRPGGRGGVLDRVAPGRDRDHRPSVPVGIEDATLADAPGGLPRAVERPVAVAETNRPGEHAAVEIVIVTQVGDQSWLREGEGGRIGRAARDPGDVIDLEEGGLLAADVQREVEVTRALAVGRAQHYCRKTHAGRRPRDDAAERIKLETVRQTGRAEAVRGVACRDRVGQQLAEHAIEDGRTGDLIARPDRGPIDASDKAFLVEQTSVVPVTGGIPRRCIQWVPRDQAGLAPSEGQVAPIADLLWRHGMIPDAHVIQSQRSRRAVVRFSTEQQGPATSFDKPARAGGGDLFAIDVDAEVVTGLTRVVAHREVVPRPVDDRIAPDQHIATVLGGESHVGFTTAPIPDKNRLPSPAASRPLLLDVVVLLAGRSQLRLRPALDGEGGARQ